MDEHGEELKTHGLEFVATDCPFVSVFSDGRRLGVTKDVDDNINLIREFSGEADAQAWKRVSDEFPERVEMIIALLGSPISVKGLAKLAWKGWRDMGINGSADLIHFL